MTEPNTNPSADTATEEATLPPSDIVNAFMELISQSCSRCQGLRAVGVTFDWSQDGVEADVGSAIWADDKGPIGPMQLNAIGGSMSQTLQLLFGQMNSLESSARIGIGRRGVLEDELQQLEKQINEQEAALASNQTAIEFFEQLQKDAPEEAPQDGGVGSDNPSVVASVPQNQV